MNNVFAGLGEPLLRRPGETHRDEYRAKRLTVKTDVRQRPPVKQRPYFPPEVNPWRLTGIQTRILRLILDGKTTKEIADDMDVTVKAVENQTSLIRERMDAATTMHAALAWDRHERSLELKNLRAAAAMVFDHRTGEMQLRPVLVVELP